jgi:glycosyltransferase involved in cell wall biosynthesis
MNILVLAPSAASEHGESRYSRELIQQLRKAGHKVDHMALGHRYTKMGVEVGQTFTTLKSHQQCCGIPDPVMEIQDRNEFGALIMRNGQPEPWQPDMPCLQGTLMPDDYTAGRSFQFVVASIRPEVVITVGAADLGILATATPLRGGYKHIHVFTFEGTTPPDSLTQGVDSVSVATMLERADSVVATSEYAADQIFKTYKGMRPLVITEGIDTDVFARLPNETKALVRRTNSTNLVQISKSGSYILDVESLEDTYNILVVGDNTERKNLPMVFDAVAKMRRNVTQDKDIRLILHVPAGINGWDIPLLLEKYKAWSWTYIHYQYTRDFAIIDRELNALYNTADLYLSLSSAEGWATAAMEATSVELPVIMQQFGGAAEWGKDTTFFVDSIATLVKPGTHETWSIPNIVSVQHLLEDAYAGSLPEDRLSKLRSTARKYDWSAVSKEWVQLLNTFTTRD